MSDETKETMDGSAAPAADGDAARRQGRKKAVVVGINNYPDPRNRLPSCVNDANRFGQLLNNQFGFTDVRTLLDGDATHDNFNDALDWLFSGATAQDKLVLFYSGHGDTRLQDGVMEEYLVLHDRSYHDDNVARRTEELAAGVFTAVIDACFSGGMDKALYELIETPVKAGLRQLFGTGGLDQRWSGVIDTGPPDLAKIKAFLPEVSYIDELAKGARPVSYKPFLGKPRALYGAARQVNPASDEVGQSPMRGMLLSASSEQETAAASGPATGGLSAFTFAFSAALQNLGAAASVRRLMEETQVILQRYGFHQTVAIKVPDDCLGLVDQPLFGTAFAAEAAQPAPAQLNNLLRQLRQHFPREDLKMTNQNMFGSPSINAILPTILPPLLSMLSQQGMSKGTAGDLSPLVPALVSALGYAGQNQWGGQKSIEGDLIRALGSMIKGTQPQQKLFGVDDAILIPALVTVITAAIKSQQPASDKSPLGDLIRVAGDIVKGPQAQPKLFGLDDAILFPAIATILAAAIKGYQPAASSGMPGMAAFGERDAQGASKGFDPSVLAPIAGAFLQALAQQLQSGGQGKAIGDADQVLPQLWNAIMDSQWANGAVRH